MPERRGRENRPGAQDDLIRAAGAVLWRDGPEPGEAEVALIHRPRYDDWSFPKGKLKNGEHVLRAVVREVEEETGIVPRLGRRLPSSTYPKDDRTKRVDYWTARGLGASDGHAVPNDEVDRIAWLPVREAEARLSYSHDVDLLREFAAGPPHTWPLVILRHGSAGEKTRWHEPDELRPLDARGRAEAQRLAGLLTAYGPARPISSATARCTETVLPYSRRTGAPAVTDTAFTIGETDTERACERLLELADDGVPVIVCTHGEIVADLITGLCRTLGEKVPDEPSLRKGSFWVAHLAGGDDGAPAISALERHGAYGEGR
ncbi:NUDIX hydrolase [Actinomadura rugatobispora]|uniref:NUDIX domain-containing protein n=1 Tax=Actinomadura rugatobispora TaxID=1994 RepID=A0ABW1AJ54_9ACTN|nr:NUDIX hydrolase [Actinomadura rugatobispora]